MKKFTNVLKKVTVVAVLGTLLATAFGAAANTGRGNDDGLWLVDSEADVVFMCEKDEKPDPDRRPLGELDFD